MTAALIQTALAGATLVLLCAGIGRWPIALLAAWIATEPWGVQLYGALMQYIAVAAPASDLGRTVASILAEALTWDHLVTGAFLATVTAQIVRGQRPMPRLIALDGLMALLSMLLLASVVFLAHNKDHALRTATDALILPFVVAMLARVLVVKRQDIYTLLGGASVLAFLLAVHGLIERASARDGLHRIQGPFPNKAVFGAVVVVALFAIVAVSFRSGFAGRVDRWLRPLWEVALHLTPAVLFFTFSRGAWIAFALGAGVLLLSARGVLSLRRVGSVALVTTLLIGMWSLTLSGQRVKGPRRPGGKAARVPVAKEVLDRHVTNVRTVKYRTRAWELLLPSIKERPLTGLGWGNAVYYLNGLRTGPMAHRTAKTAHSAYLTILFEMGAIAFACFLAVQAAIIQRALALLRAPGDAEARWLGVTVLTLTIAYAVPGITSGTFTRPSIANFLYYAVVGAVLAAGAQAHSPRASWEAGRS